MRDRFDRPLLARYLAANGIRVDDPGFHGAGHLIARSAAPHTRTESAAQVRARFGWTEPWW